MNGTASLSIPLPFASTRGNALAALNLSYNSGSGNGIFGLGWTLNLSSIKRKTDNKLPRYHDEADSDIFLLSEADDLVPEYAKGADGRLRNNTDSTFIYKEKLSPDGFFMIRSYRPRIEGLYARIERWTDLATKERKWRVVTRDNITTLFGWSASSRISDPAAPAKIYEWLPEITFDDKGNCAYYKYKKEDGKGIKPGKLHQQNRLRNGQPTYTNLYLDKVLYGNKTPFGLFGAAYPDEADYLFQTVFDYGEYEMNAPFAKGGEWEYRTDSFSDYRAGFEIRTTRLCRRVLLFHYFAELPGGSAVVRSLDFAYDTAGDVGLTFLISTTTHGYIKKPDGGYTDKAMPPLEFGYQQLEWNKEIKPLAAEALIHAPAGLDEPRYQFTDLFNEGLSGILTEQAGAWFYKHNLGNGNFGPAKCIAPKPSFTGLGSKLQLMDLAADGIKQLVSLSGEPRGYFELSEREEWQRFQPFQHLPNINMDDANVHLLDLNGDGQAEILVTEDHIFTWYESAGREGYQDRHRVYNPFDEEAGPYLVFSDPRQSFFKADMSGDGLIDMVRVRNGQICYWPNLGNGNFGAKVEMDHAPVFDHPDVYHPSYLRFADIDGSGTTDIIYLGKNKFTCWMNLSGNEFAVVPVEIDSFPEIHNLTETTVVDLLGNGVACVVWSSPLAKDAPSPLRYIDLMNGKKPHVMVLYKNNLGKEVKLKYTPSTTFCLEDRQAGNPWATKLHFPVQCISETEIRDCVSGYRFVSAYRYHHGYYDHMEREFRGFGMVEKTDTEQFDHWIKGGASNIVDQTLHQAPVLTKSWYHTGAYLDMGNSSNPFAEGYWHAVMAKHGFEVDNLEAALPDSWIDAAPVTDPGHIAQPSGREMREAFRACKGKTLRVEIFSCDAPVSDASDEQIRKQLTPYSVAEYNWMIELLQPTGQNEHAVFAVKDSETVTYNYERNTKDPRILHTLNLKSDEYGNILESASVVYPRLQPEDSLPAPVKEAQSRTTITFTENRYTNDVDTDNAYRLRLPAETRNYELRGIPKNGTLYAISDFADILTASAEVDYHQTEQAPEPGSPVRRLIEHVRTLYRSNNLKDTLSSDQLESLALPFEKYQLVCSSNLLESVYGAKVNEELMLEGKYTLLDGNEHWWRGSGTTQFLETGEAAASARSRFYLPISYTDPYGAITKVKYEENYHLYMEATEDALGNTTRIELFNFRTLSAQRIKDLNHNISEVLTDELGFVKAMAVLGKGTEADDLEGVSEYASPSENTLTDEFFHSGASDTLMARGKSLLQHATARFVYDLDAYTRSGKPAVAASILREQHYKTNSDSPVQISLEYSGGLGQTVMKKVQAEPGAAKQVIIHADHTYTVSTVDTAALEPKQLRWIGSGRSVLNNKGNPVKQYEPYFSVTHHYEDLQVLVETGVTPVFYYDAPGRLIRTEMPNGTLTRTEFDAWKQVIYDLNDTVLESEWYAKRSKRQIDAELIAAGKDPAREKAAADQSAKHAGTPNVQHLDTLGRPVLSTEHNRDLNGDEEFCLTLAELDIEGNLRKVTDARGNAVMMFKYDMLGNKIYQNSMDAGQRWTLMNILNLPLRTWDERKHEFQYDYDLLHRPTHSKVIGGDGEAPLNHIVERIIYGETQQSAELSNLKGQIFRRYDTGGMLEMPGYDFKGQSRSTTRKLFSNYKGVADWTDANLAADLEAEGFTFVTETDALGRITKQTAPDGSVIVPAYNEAGLLDSESVTHPGSSQDAVYIKNIDYNEKGQRNSIEYGNAVITRFYYDKETFRLNRLETKRMNGDPLQDWSYTYDPAGNITHMEDRNIPAVFFDNQKITGVSTYMYDALYRLAEATGRENDSAVAPGNTDNWSDFTFMKQLNPGDPLAMRKYTQSYLYDKAGNIVQISHQARDNNWTRKYNYQAANNRLISTQLGAHKYSYTLHPRHGYITAMPHLEEMVWNFKEELIGTIRQKRTDGGTAETTYYQYDSQGQRLRKITENQANRGDIPNKKDERIYIGGYERYKQHSGTDAGLERTSLSLMDKQHRLVMIDTETKPRAIVGIPMGRTAPVQTVRYQLHNHLGSAALELDGTARVISYEEFHPYGTTAYQARNAAIKCAAKRYRYTGMERDEESGLEYHSARYYASWLGRWVSADPADLSGGLNVYRYAMNNPVKFFDANGMWEVDMHLGAVYWVGRLAGATHKEALQAAIASQSLDDSMHTEATWMKTIAFFTMSDEKMNRANNSHSLNVTSEESLRVAKAGIDSKNIHLFGLGLHSAGDFLPHANLSGYSTWGHQNGMNEDLSISFMFTSTADETHRNPNKALATFERFRTLWSGYKGTESKIPEFDKKTLALISDFINAKDEKAKTEALKKGLQAAKVGEEEIEQFLALFGDKEARQALWESSSTDQSQIEALEQSGTIWDSIQNGENTKLMNSRQINIDDELNGLPTMSKNQVLLNEQEEDSRSSIDAHRRRIHEFAR